MSCVQVKPRPHHAGDYSRRKRRLSPFPATILIVATRQCGRGLRVQFRCVYGHSDDRRLGEKPAETVERLLSATTRIAIEAGGSDNAILLYYARGERPKSQNAAAETSESPKIMSV